MPPARHAKFLPDDTGKARSENSGMSKQMNSEDRAHVAFTRFQELMADLGFTEDESIAFIYDMVGEPAELGKKAIKQWFTRQTIPPYMIFNIAAELGVDVGWLGGLNPIPKDRAIHKGGRYHRDWERFQRVRAEASAKRPRKAG